MANTTYSPIMLDILISDVKSKDLHRKVSEMLYTKYLSDSEEESDDGEGILYGTFNASCAR